MDADKFWKSLETAGSLDRVGDLVKRWLSPIVGHGATRKVLGGEWLGHPIHPALVTIPLGTWSSAVALDLAGHQSVAARRLVGLGTIAAPAAIATGWSDWSVLNATQRKVGLSHAAANGIAVLLFSLSYWRRRTVTDGFARSTAILGLVAAGGGGAIGGHLAYRLGANVAAGQPETKVAATYHSAQRPRAIEQPSSLDL